MLRLTRGKVQLMTRGMTRARTFSSIKVSHTPENICVVHFNDPARFNAMTETMGEEFEFLMHKLTKSFSSEEGKGERVRGLVITGEGRAFSAGGDMDFLYARSQTAPLDNAHIMKRFYQRFLSVREVPVPTIAAINGPAIGAGLAVALACDFRVASPTASMGVTFTSLGIHPGMGSSHFLPQLIPPLKANRMLFMSEKFTGEEGAAFGLVEVAEDPLAQALEMAKGMAQMPEAGVRTLVTSQRSKQNVGLDDALWREATSQAECYASTDFLHTITAMRDKLAAKRKAKEAKAASKL